MQRSNTPWPALSGPSLLWQEDGSPFSPTFADFYYSPDNGLAEGRHVFLAGNGLPERWQRHRADPFVVAETGFGTGLNFLLTWQAWRARRKTADGRRLHYLALEKYPLAVADLRRAGAAWPELAPLLAELLAQYPQPLPGVHRALLDGGSVLLDLWWGDVEAVLEDLGRARAPLVDAWYLDGFAPARNPAMWQPGLWPKVAALSRPEATFATFTVARAVRFGLTEAGFAVRKVPGFGHKREQLCGQLTSRQPLPPLQGTPWELAGHRQETPQQVLVIGGGLAGCHTAAALARRGIRVTVLERGQVAGEASGNPQGVLYTRLSHRHSPLTDFALASFDFASRQYRAGFAAGTLQPGSDGELCGSFHQVADSAELARMRPLLAPLPELAQVLEADSASTLLGIAQPGAGYWYPNSGWMSPPALCRHLLQHPLVTLHEGCGAIRLQWADDAWQAVTSAGTLARAPAAVVAAGTHCSELDHLDWLPLNPIRGQTTQLPPLPALAALRAVLCHSGYLAPATADGHCIGATFAPGDTDPELRRGDRVQNLEQLAAAIPAVAGALAGLADTELPGRTGWRCASPDYLPLVGPVPDRSAFLRDYAGLRDNARSGIPLPGKYLPGLYLNTGHGSRGLTSTPLAAELLASQLCAEPLPLEPELVRALAPARFIIRDLGRNRI
ncbi:bifunctional tRNA (5-methylaminomethyl-2-thiouridine)(34)-methyltransferase MnmD/FAD-dependent 5-carboxymethylaminomethyl-2-thiouridine(34) oxidoreductase MnmC [Haliea sp. E1-2-M8]|uniref:bifunctional tRNA (5-methylaminomethyl-2-thiouridine)(34)-methyltransferase MnmD/FAD-dependent 5-carboxymethylaminomethyl-2-thiouridine(34) oxidoreductase MnmC n=1 Tax=Haliea sp. E1-2-M8 TaxID=3064706 RepID=UPI00271A883A|nr:bifunctional tRNA (5-methylaminomethyl-2-thiouridine)(34)-methyltransferase MnmD/FAD-dependent 5-carboxymethylaminomethyl-2-thiouridine(34) oxidoreductase MnmC [Haliea sp. E1-2-M8]MDO8861207.1 bifunctional tRNA (5-methylaminomethyl-2-thiouridine)(34)-methyltransferase MnmD/FAD-dependent 5-carboxymethylaminomethyl-2-thiouridine(34) oxidoreductase MnmC [Haliea sp. E1-2-M8]